MPLLILVTNMERQGLGDGVKERDMTAEVFLPPYVFEKVWVCIDVDLLLSPSHYSLRIEASGDLSYITHSK